MKKLYSIVVCCLLFRPEAAAAEKYNPFFGEYQNQAMFNFGQGVNSFGLISLPDLPVPFNMLQFAYSQPATFFRLPARQTISFIKTIGYGKKYRYDSYKVSHDIYEPVEWDWKAYATEIAMLSGDAALFHTERFYFGLGLDVGVQGKQNERFGTKFMTGFKILAGYKIADRWLAEFLIQHFSNGDTGGEANFSYNFWGLGIGYNF